MIDDYTEYRRSQMARLQDELDNCRHSQRVVADWLKFGGCLALMAAFWFWFFWGLGA